MTIFNRFLILGWLLALASGSASAAEVKCTNPFLFDTKPTFRLQDMSRLVGNTKPIYDDEFVFWVEPFDDEDQPEKDGRYAVAIVFAGRHDIGAPVIGGVLWSRRFAKWNEARSEVLDKTGAGHFAVFTLDDPKAACPNRDLVVRFDPKGELWVDGRKVDQLPPE